MPPAAIYCNEESTLEFEQFITGDPGRGVDKRYSDEKVYFRVGGDNKYQLAATKREVFDSTRMIIRATIPAIKDNVGNRLEYYYEKKLDGHVNSWGTHEVPKTIPIKKR